jgi:hypothetical protein
MKHSRVSGEQVIAMLKENEAEAKVDDICRSHGGGTDQVLDMLAMNELLQKHL